MLRTKVQIEAARNGWYFLRECIRIYEQGGNPVPFSLHRGSCAMIWSFLNGIDYLGMQPRQSQPLSAKIKTPSGWSTMGAMEIGSEVLTPDGSVAKVLGIYPHGMVDIFRITLKNGRSVECADDHLWKIYRDAESDEFDIISCFDLRHETGEVYLPVFDPIAGRVNRALISKIEFAGIEDTQCIEIDHPDHLYITDDWIVTRNTGKTVAALALTAWIIYSAGDDFQIGMLAKDNSLREENVKRVKSFGENLPDWWVIKDRYNDKNNTTEIFYKALKTHYVTFVGQKEKASADKQARGASPPAFHFDEFEYTSNIGTSYPTILSSTSRSRINAKKNGRPHSNLITTTAGDPTSEPCAEAIKILSGAMPFSEFLYDIENAEKLHEIVEAASPQKMLNGTFSHLQLGLDNKWLRDIISRNRLSRDQVMRDYLNKRVSIQEKPIIDKDILATINSSQMEPTWIDMRSSKFVLYWYLPKEEVLSTSFRDRPIVVGCDSSEMIGRDCTTLVGLDPTDLSVVFTFKCNEGNINVIGTMIANLLLEYPNFVFIPENKSSGTSFIDSISLILRNNGHNPFKRMFNWIVNNKHEKEFSHYDIRDMSLLDTVAKKYFGIKTDKSKRDELYSSVLIDGTTLGCKGVRDQNLILELNSLVERNGRVDHGVNGHDDATIAYLMAVYFILNGKHLDVYGIKPGTIMSKSSRTGADDELEIARRQQKIMDKIEDLTAGLRYQTDPGLRKLLSNDIDVLKSMLDDRKVLIPQTADELNRDPKRFSDTDAVNRYRKPVSTDEINSSIKMMMTMGR